MAKNAKTNGVVYSYFNPPPAVGAVFGPSMTQEEFKDECDINRIMARYSKTGTVAGRTDMGTYGDFSAGVDYLEAQNIILRSNEQFAALPSKVREQFRNSPKLFLDFVHSKDTTLEMLNDMGLLNDEAKARLKPKVNVADIVPKPAA
ncbi:MAG: internal scaffolding protein [Arizlama microvirus]|nr:MAG: internal scaffolding protein [Arizlama microvirus]